MLSGKDGFFMLSGKKVNYALMAFVVLAWGFEYVAAKAALDTIKPITLVFFKYLVGAIILLTIKLVRDRRFPFTLRDVPFFVLCGVFGDVIYFSCEYGAMSYLPVSLLTIILSFVPVISIAVESVIYKTRPTLPIIVGIIVSIAGVTLVIGADFSGLFEGGQVWGYLLAFGAIISWNIYNFTTKRLTEHYNSFDLTLYQLICAMIISAPYMAFNLPAAAEVDTQVILSVIYLGAASSALCFLIYVNAIKVIGVTPSALFSNMLPVSTTLFGWLFLDEKVSLLQIAGGVIVVAASSFVIVRKNRE
jgi:drug/metabolite transporter (DMT)-like permease